MSAPALRLITDLGPGESEVLALALETPNSVVILDDDLARRTAEMSGIRLTGTLGMLLDAKQAGLLEEIARCSKGSKLLDSAYPKVQKPQS